VEVTNSHVLKLGTGIIRMISFTPQLPYPGHRTPDIRWIGGRVSPEMARTLWRKETLLLPGIESWLPSSWPNHWDTDDELGSCREAGSDDLSWVHQTVAHWRYIEFLVIELQLVNSTLLFDLARIVSWARRAHCPGPTKIF
jgi:hypothetical protein